MDEMEFSAESSIIKDKILDPSVRKKELYNFRKALATLEFVMRLNNYADEDSAAVVPTVLSLNQLVQKLAQLR